MRIDEGGAIVRKVEEDAELIRQRVEERGGDETVQIVGKAVGMLAIAGLLAGLRALTDRFLP